jgi:transcriptional regulator with XRE-family HTH domain
MPRTVRATADFGPRLRQLRQARGWTLAELAKRIDGTVRAVFYYEQEGRYPPAPVVGKLAEVLGVSMECLLYGDDLPTPSADPEAPDLLNTPEDRRLWRKFKLLKELNERNQAMVLKMLSSLHENQQKND